MAKLDIVDNELFDSAKSILEKVGLSAVEVEMLINTNKLLMRPYPSTVNEIERRLEQLSHYRVRITNILLRTKQMLIEKTKEKDLRYSKKFAQLSKATNATNQAIESQVTSQDGYLEINQKCEEIHNVYKYLFSLIKDIDEVKSNLHLLFSDTRRKDYD